MTDAFVHPLTGQLLEATPENLRQADRDAHDRLGEIYRALEPVADVLAAMPLVLPPPALRTETQKKVARCPRCSTLLDPPAEADRDGVPDPDFGDTPF